MPSVFISYRSDDSYHSAPLIYEMLAKVFGKANVFLDKGTMDAGEDFDEAVWPALAEAEVFIVVIGTDWVGLNEDGGSRRIDDVNDFPRREVRLALERRQRDGILVLPVRIQGANHQKMALPDDIKQLASINGIPLGEWYEDDLGVLIGKVAKRVPRLKLRKPNKKAKAASKPSQSITIKTGGGDLRGNIIANGNVHGSIRNAVDIDE
jgi:hypothetical protein